MNLKPLANSTLKILSEQKRIFASATMLAAVLLAFISGAFLIPQIDFGFMRMSPFSFGDVIFAVVSAILIGGIVALYSYKFGTKFSEKAGFGAGIAGTVSAVCPACQGVNIVASGSTIASLSTAFLVPLIPFIQFASLVLLGFGFYATANSIYTKNFGGGIRRISSSEKTESAPSAPEDELHFFEKNKLMFVALVVAVALVFINQVYSISVFSALAGPPSGAAVAITSGPNKLEYGSKITLKPMPLATGEQPMIASYKSKVKPIPTISELQITPSSGDLTTDLKNNVVPHGTPSYGAEAGVSFDDPVAAQKVWNKYRSIQLDGPLQERWNRIVNSFTCDYCCGSPQQPTIITRCGCAHATGAQGMAKWFLKYYGDKYSDEEIYGEMARWFALWYPGPTIKRIIKEAGA